MSHDFGISRDSERAKNREHAEIVSEPCVKNKQRSRASHDFGISRDSERAMPREQANKLSEPGA